MPTLNLGQVRPVYRGAWNSIDTYTAYDFVIYNGSAYLALKDVPANYEPPSQTEYWVLFGAKGEQGEPGADGVDGAQGERGPSPAYRWDGTFLSIQNPDGSWPDQGIDLQGPPVPLSNSVTSTSETDAASSKAVKTAYDQGSSGIAAAENAQTDIASLRSDVPSLAAHAAMPSDRYISINLQLNTVLEYTAVADGFIFIRLISTTNGRVYCERKTDTNMFAQNIPITSSLENTGGTGNIVFQVKSGEKISYAAYGTAASVDNAIIARFYYAEGAGS